MIFDKEPDLGVVNKLIRSANEMLGALSSAKNVPKPPIVVILGKNLFDKAKKEAAGEPDDREVLFFGKVIVFKSEIENLLTVTVSFDWAIDVLVGDDKVSKETKH